MSAALQKLGKDARAARIKVLHQYEGHAGISVGGHARKKGLEGR